MNGKSGGYKLLTVYITNPRKMGGVEVERGENNEWKKRRKDGGKKTRGKGLREGDEMVKGKEGWSGQSWG